jgi:hypothetical protein
MDGHTRNPPPFGGMPGKTRPVLDARLSDPLLRAAASHWETLRGGRVVPSRMDLDPAALRPLLQSCAILEQPRPGTLRIRLGGARISALMGMEVRGLPLRALFDLADRGRIGTEVEAALADPAIVLIDAVTPAPRYQSREVLGTRIAILPLADRDGIVSRALYVMGEVDGTPERLPHMPLRWCLSRIERVALRAGTPVLTPQPLPAQGPAPSREIDETASETRGPMARARFRVIEGGLA